MRARWRAFRRRTEFSPLRLYRRDYLIPRAAILSSLSAELLALLLLLVLLLFPSFAVSCRVKRHKEMPCLTMGEIRM